MQDIKKALNLFDKDHDGNIITAELDSVMRSLGLAPTDQEVRAMIRKVDSDSEYLKLTLEKGFLIHLLKSINPCQPAQSAQADIGRIFLPFYLIAST